MVDLMNEGIPGPDPGGQWSWSGILAYTVDMYGGVGGQMMAQAFNDPTYGPPGYVPPTEPTGRLIGGGVTGPPDEWGGSSGYVGGAQTTPPTGGSPHTPNNPHGGGATPQAFNYQGLELAIAQSISFAAAHALHQVNSGLWGVKGYIWQAQWRGIPPNQIPQGGGGGQGRGWKPGPTEKWIEDSEFARARGNNAIGQPQGLTDSIPPMGEYGSVVDFAHSIEYSEIMSSLNMEGLYSEGYVVFPNVIWDEMGNSTITSVHALNLNTLMWEY